MPGNIMDWLIRGKRQFSPYKKKVKTVQPNEIYRDGFRQSPFTEYYNKLCAEYDSPEKRAIAFSMFGALKRNLLKILKAHFKWLVDDENNFITYIFGRPGEGKSRFAQKVYRLLRDIIRENVTIESSLHYTKNMDASRTVFSAMKDCDTCIQDEDPKIHGRGSKTGLDAMDALLQQLRKTRKNIIFCSPRLHRYTGVEIAFEMMGRNKDRKVSRALVHYYDENGADAILGYVKLNVGGPEGDAMYAEYLKLVKDPNLHAIQITGGVVMATANIDLIEQLVPAFVDYALEHGFENSRPEPSKKELRLVWFPKFSKGKEIALVGDDLDRLAILAATELKRRQSDTKKEKTTMNENNKNETIGDVFDGRIERDRALAIIEADTNPVWQERVKKGLLQIYRRVQVKGERQTDVASDLHLSDKLISDYITQIGGRVSEIVGHQYEKFVAHQLEQSGEFDEVNCTGEKADMPDIYATRGRALFIWSCKCYERRNSKHYDQKEKAVGAEVRFAIMNHTEYDSVTTYFRYLNIADGLERTVVFDYSNPPKSFNIEYIETSSQACVNL